MPELFFDHALLPDGWARNVAVAVENGQIRDVKSDITPPEGAERVPGIAIPALANLHSHTFQRAMAGLAERRGPANDSFWTWREVMYRFLGQLNPDDVEAIAAFAMMEMLEGGFAAVAEFHYLHHDPAGVTYDDLAELSGRIVQAAAETGIGLTLLPVFYANGGFGGAEPAEGQRRFLNDADGFLRLVDGARSKLDVLPGAVLGIAPHSLRAVTPESLDAVLSRAQIGDGPIHIHVAEQIGEVEQCLTWSGRRPVDWLLDNVPVDRRWCLIHATHLTEREVERLAATGAVAGLCPITEASLGDGIFPGREFLVAGGRFGVGTDSNIQISAPGELRQLEYSQRLKHRGRNLIATTAGESTGRRLYDTALAAGAQALGQSCGAIASGRRADIVVLDDNNPDIAGRDGDLWLDAYVFVAGKSAIRTVFSRGRRVVDEGRHIARDAVMARYLETVKRLTEQ